MDDSTFVVASRDKTLSLHSVSTALKSYTKAKEEEEEEEEHVEFKISNYYPITTTLGGTKKVRSVRYSEKNQKVLFMLLLFFVVFVVVVVIFS